MYRISKDFYFSAAHRLDGLSPDHPCGRDHGHNYTVRVTLASPTLDAVGMVLDYGDLSPLAKFIEANLDHRHLNEVMQSNPTAENLAAMLLTFCLERWPQTVAVAVSETGKTWAEASVM